MGLRGGGCGTDRMNATRRQDDPPNGVASDGGAGTAVSSGSTAGGNAVIACVSRLPPQHGQGGRRLPVGECRLQMQRSHASPQACSAAKSRQAAATGQVPLAAAMSSHTVSVRSSLMLGPTEFREVPGSSRRGQRSKTTASTRSAVAASRPFSTAVSVPATAKAGKTTLVRCTLVRWRQYYGTASCRRRPTGTRVRSHRCYNPLRSRSSPFAPDAGDEAPTLAAG